MGLISGQRANTGLIEVFLNSNYDSVKAVAENLDVIIASPDNAQLAAAKATVAELHATAAHTDYLLTASLAATVQELTSTTTATATVTGTGTADLVTGTMADNDFFRIRIGGTAADVGWTEIATADNGNEPIYVRQYTGQFVTVARTATLLDGSGNTSFPGTVTQGSDIRLKEDITPVTEALDKINGINGVYYTLKHNGERCIGVIAQEVQAVLPEVVRDDGSKEKMLSVGYSNMVGLLIEGIKELNAKNTALEARLAVLEAHIA